MGKRNAQTVSIDIMPIPQQKSSFHTKKSVNNTCPVVHIQDCRLASWLEVACALKCSVSLVALLGVMTRCKKQRTTSAELKKTYMRCGSILFNTAHFLSELCVYLGSHCSAQWLRMEVKIVILCNIFFFPMWPRKKIGWPSCCGRRLIKVILITSLRTNHWKLEE